MSTLYLKMSTTVGDATHSQFTRQIECVGIGHTIALPVESGSLRGGARVQGDSRLGPVLLYRHPDRASPALRSAAIENDHQGDMEINRVQAINGQSLPVETILLANARVDRLEMVTLLNRESAEPRSEYLECIHLSFDEIRWVHTRYAASGGLRFGSVEGGWSISLKSTEF